ncbi:hypothetical protein GVY41_12680 [Frigidibacter albus]|uniref:Uncharacterized protein n=1 Tax=Frigidibacter albus TaxID=1465486 RepID=A0A6L8VJL3_9RHOB|nr:hypothetical protein [Frigidibacter albus]MZQ89772.1 hypothetical protein [Frigidibacter albus]NBE31853.1 hypothetical protein [Frigidibacter albus]GGH56742.1 hypothetical protein GCM10011341_25520 [Frigidibacter albus]
MAARKPKPRAFNVLAVVQQGRLEYESVVLAASFRAQNADFAGRLILAEPQPGPRWKSDPRISEPVRKLLISLGAEIVPFENQQFGQSYPYGNKIEALAALPADVPFVFFDTDTIFTGPLAEVEFDFDRPSASMRREGTWPEVPLYGPGYGEIWKSLYDRFGLDYASSLDLSQPDEYWARYLYFNAGWFFYKDPAVFGQRFLEYAVAIRNEPTDALASQSLDPWLDQVALPLVIHGLGGGRPGPGLAGLDGDVTCHYRTFPMLYARETDRVVEVLEQVTAPNAVKKVLKDWEPIKKIVYQGKGAKVRAMFDREDLPRREAMIRNRIKAEGLWFR